MIATPSQDQPAHEQWWGILNIRCRALREHISQASFTADTSAPADPTRTSLMPSATVLPAAKGDRLRPLKNKQTVPGPDIGLFFLSISAWGQTGNTL